MTRITGTSPPRATLPPGATPGTTPLSPTTATPPPAPLEPTRGVTEVAAVAPRDDRPAVAAHIVVEGAPVVQLREGMTRAERMRAVRKNRVSSHRHVLEQCRTPVRPGDRVKISFRKRWAEDLDPLLGERELGERPSSPGRMGVILRYRFDHGEWHKETLCDGAMDRRSGSPLVRDAVLQIPEEASAELEFGFDVYRGVAEGFPETSAGYGAVLRGIDNHSLTVQPERPPTDARTFYALSPEGVSTQVQRGPASTCAPEQIVIPKRFFNLDAQGRPVVWTDHAANPVASPEKRRRVFLRGPFVEVKVGNLTDVTRYTLEEAAVAGMTCFTIGNEVREMVEAGRGRPFAWYKGAPIMAAPFAGSANFDDSLNARAALDDEDMDADGRPNGVVGFTFRTQLDAWDEIPGLDGLHPDVVARYPGVVAHEFGHQVLWGFLDEWYPDTVELDMRHITRETPFLAFGEGIADIVAILHTLAQPSAVETVLEQTGGDLHRPNRASRLGGFDAFLAGIRANIPVQKIVERTGFDVTAGHLFDPPLYDRFRESLRRDVGGLVYARSYQDTESAPPSFHRARQEKVVEILDACYEAALAKLGSDLQAEQVGPADADVPARVQAALTDPSIGPALFDRLGAYLHEELLSESLRVHGEEFTRVLRRLLPPPSPYLPQRDVGDRVASSFTELKQWLTHDPPPAPSASGSSPAEALRPAIYEEFRRSAGAGVQAAVAKWAESYDVSQLDNYDGREFHELHRLDRTEREPHQASLVLSSAAYQVLADEVSRRTAAGEEPRQAVAQAREAVASTVFAALDRLPHIEQLSWEAIAYALCRQASESGPRQLALWQTAFGARGLPVQAASVRRGTEHLVLHDPVAHLGITAPVREVEVQYRVAGGPVQRAPIREGQGRIPIPSDSSGELECWFRVVTEDGQELWDSNGGYGANYRAAIE